MAERLGREPGEVAAATFGSGIEDRADAGALGPGEYLRAVGVFLAAAMGCRRPTPCSSTTRPPPGVPVGPRSSGPSSSAGSPR
jgi:hypothetical protein